MVRYWYILFAVFMQLTLNDGQVVFLEQGAVQYFSPWHNGSIIALSSGKYIEVQENPEIILRKWRD